jgi:type IV pilus assembly protein PilO
MAIELKLDTILKLPLSRRLIILAVINILIAGLFYQFLLSPKQTEIRDLRDRSEELKVKLNESRMIARDIPKFEKERNELQEKLKKAVAQLPNEKEIPDLIDSIAEAGREAGLKIFLFKPMSEVPRGFYSEVPVNMAVEGSFESIFLFTRKVGKLPRIVNISGIAITLPKAQLTSRTPKLDASFVTTTFRFIPDKGVQ